MKIIKATFIAIVLFAIIFMSFSCAKSSAATSTTATRTAAVTKGTLTNSITGTGNLAYSTTEDLKFELHSFVEEILVSEGDTVKKDQKLVTLDTTAWDTQIEGLTKTLSNMQRSLATKQRALATKQRALLTKQDTLAARQIALAAAQRAVTDKEFALKQAQTDIDTATYNLQQITEIKDAQATIDSVQAQIDIAKANLALAGVTGDRTIWQNLINDLSVDDPATGKVSSLTAAKKRLASLINLTDPTLKVSSALDIAKLELTLQQKQKGLLDAKQAIEDAKNNVNTAQLNVNYAQADINEGQLDINDAQLDIKDAERDVKDAQSNLDEAKAISPIIVAPFDGYIIKIPVTGGQEVQKGTIGAIIADPNKFEADILVTENDINTIKLNGDATVAIDAVATSFPAKITWIAPTATVNQGVVNYHVTVTLTSLKPITGTGSQQGGAGSGQPPRPPPQGGSGGGGAPPPGGGGAGGGGAPRPPPPGGSNTGATAKDITLKQGLSATVTVVSEQKTNILYVPNKAISRQGTNMTVKVINGTALEPRTVKTGMTDGTNTEITEGLKEGEQVSYTVTITTAASNVRSGLQLGVGGGGAPPGGGGGPPPPPGGGGGGPR